MTSRATKTPLDLTGKDILSLDQFTPKKLTQLFDHAAKMRELVESKRPSDTLAGTVTTLLFYEPSSRTFGSFAAAIKRLGGQTIEIQDPQTFSSVSKGETLEDTIRVFEAYSDAIVMRHGQQGTAQKAADAAEIPIINAGDGIGEHPTQGLLDLCTIYEKHGRLDNLTGVFAGDILNGRTLHSTIRGLSLYPGNTLYLLSPEELRLSREHFQEFTDRGVKLIEITNETDMPKDADFWYWTRVQKERFTSLADYEKAKSNFVITPKLVKDKAGGDTTIMHPLPRVGEIEAAVDKDPRAVYLRSQIRNGMYVRMALMALVLGKDTS